MRLQFGDCMLDLDTRELSRGGKPVHVEPKAYKLLELLFAARPKALSKDELQDELWPKTFVSERSLARLVEVLRDCLGDSAKEPRYIRTVHGFGYAFSGDARELSRASRHASAAGYNCRIVWGDREIALEEGENVLGRDPSVAVWIDLNSVSRRHARILVAAGVATIEDLGSRNGTYVGGEMIGEARKRANGDTIKVGAAKLVFRCFRGLGSTQSEVSSMEGRSFVRSPRRITHFGATCSYARRTSSRFCGAHACGSSRPWLDDVSRRASLGVAPAPRPPSRNPAESSGP